MKAMQLPAGWYVVADVSELKARKPLAIERFGLALVLWRQENGSIVAMLDQCPHRSAKLSVGSLVGNSIQCKFHGFEFDACGSCQLVPETRKAAPNLKVPIFPVREMHGFIWIWHGQSEPAAELPWFDALLQGSWSYSKQSTTWPTHVSRCIENQLDYAHLPYVHRNTIGGNMDVTKKVTFETCDEYIRFFPSGKEAGTGFIEFRFPNIWSLTIVPGKFGQMMAFVPVSENETKLYLRGYQSFITIFGLAQIFDTIGAWQSAYILNQDREVVLSQHPRSSIDSDHEILYPSDTAIKFFRERWRASQRS